MGFQIQILSILCFSWSFLVKFCVHLRTSSSKSQMHASSREEYIQRILIVLICYRFIAFIFDLSRLLSFVC